MLHNSNTIIGTPKWHYPSSFFLTHQIKKPLYSLSPTKIPMPQKKCTMRAMEVGEENLLEPVNENAFKLPESTLGRYLARRLVQIGVTDIFGVPGDANLTLLDQFIAEPGIEFIGCCNELNAGYAADGYARARGVGACVFTFTVGGLSALNAIAGAYSENLPLICIVGGPNSNYYGKNVTVHHSIGLPDFSQELKCFELVTCYQAVVTNLEDAHEQIDRAITTALRESKPVYISISSNLPATPHPSFRQKMPPPFFLTPRTSNPMSLEAAVKAAAALLNKAERPVLVAGSKLRIAKSCEAFVHLANACGYAITAMPAAKGLVPENHPQFMGTYWGRSNSSSLCAETFESADACLYAGPVFDDLSTNGYSIHLDKETSIIVQPQRVEIGNKISVEGVLMEDFLRALGGQLKHNARSFEDYRMMCVRTGLESAEVRGRPKEALKADVLFKHVQKMVSSDSVVVVETGDAWFYTQKLKLPQGCGYEIQMLYASIGWSVGATLGYAQAAPHRRVIACIGDGSFQMAAQEVSTMLQCGQRSIIFLTNNDGYAIEAKIHDGPYNVIKKWDYTAVVNAIHNGHGNFWAAQVRCEEELVAAVDMAMGEKKDHLCLIEVMLHKHDTSKELLHWAAKLVDPNASPP